jgi:hypothetical protein
MLLEATQTPYWRRYRKFVYMLNRFHCPSVVIPLTELQWGVFLSEIPPSSVSFRKPFHPFPSPAIFHSALCSWYTNMTRTKLKYQKATRDTS